MDWNNGNLRVPFVSRTVAPSDNSFNLLYNYNYDQYQGMEMKHAMQSTTTHGGMLPRMDTNNFANNQLDKKKRLTSDQLESLENSFQEEIKLDPDRKMKLAQELGLQPRQIAVWFQNRRARWKTKQLERLYDSLKQDYDMVSREKQKLQDEVLALRAILKEQAAAGGTGTKKQVSTANYTEISGEETVESTSIPIISSNKTTRGTSNTNNNNNNMGECSYVYNVVDGFNSMNIPPYNWPSLPSYP